MSDNSREAKKLTKWGRKGYKGKQKELQLKNFLKKTRARLTKLSMNNKSLFNVLIESVGPEQSFFQEFWTYGDHIGEAIERVLSACSTLQIPNAIASEADFVNSDLLPDGVVDNKKLNVYYTPGRSYFPTEESFIAPFGIIKAQENGEFDYGLIREGFSLMKRDDGIYELNAVVQRDKLFDTFIELVKRLPSIKVFWVALAADWEDKNREEFWTNEKLNAAGLIEGYLRSHWNDTVANGHVALTVYSSVGQTNLSIGTHKSIKVLGKSAPIQRTMAAALRRLGYQELAELYSLEGGYYHYHYRPERSKSRQRLIAALKEDGFTLWNEEAVQPDD